MQINKNGEVIIDLEEIASAMTDEQKTRLAHYVAWDDMIFEMVIGRLFGDMVWDGWSTWPDTVAQKLREQIIEAVGGTIVKETVKRLMIERDQAKANEQRMDRWAWALYHAWPDEYFGRRPDHEKYVSAQWPNEKQIEAELVRDAA